MMALRSCLSCLDCLYVYPDMPGDAPGEGERERTLDCPTLKACTSLIPLHRSRTCRPDVDVLTDYYVFRKAFDGQDISLRGYLRNARHIVSCSLTSLRPLT